MFIVVIKKYKIGAFSHILNLSKNIRLRTQRTKHFQKNIHYCNSAFIFTCLMLDKIILMEIYLLFFK